MLACSYVTIDDPALAVRAYDKFKVAYGNASVPMNSDDFWLGRPLAISSRK
jgi:beta-lactamase class D